MIKLIYLSPFMFTIKRVKALFMKISKYILVVIIGFYANHSSCMFFTKKQIRHAERRQHEWNANLSPRTSPKKKGSLSAMTATPGKIIQHDPLSPLLERIAPDYVQLAYANWGMENQDERWQTSSKGKSPLTDSQERTQ